MWLVQYHYCYMYVILEFWGFVTLIRKEKKNEHVVSGRYVTTWGLVWGATKCRLSTLQPYRTIREIDIEAFTTYLNCDMLILVLIRADSPKASAILCLNQPLEFLGGGFTGTCKGIPFIVLLFLLHSKFFFVGIHLRCSFHVRL